MKTNRVVIVGAGVAGARAAEAIAERTTEQVIVIGAEPEFPYHRPVVSKEMLRGDTLSDEDLWIATRPQWEARGIHLRPGVFAIALRPDEQALWLSDGEVLHFDRLVVATGSNPRRLQAPGASLPGVLTLRTLHDARVLAPRLDPGRRVVVIGAGILGLEVAEVAQRRGADVTVLERGSGALTRLVGPLLSDRTTQWLSTNVRLRTSQWVRRVVGSTRAEGVELASGEILPADTVVTALGVEPATHWLEGSGLALDQQALRVDEHGQTNHPRVFGAGEVTAAWSPTLKKHVRVEHSGWAWQHGDVVGQNAAGGREVFDALPAAGATLWGRRLQVAGDVHGAQSCVLTPGGSLAVLERDAVVCAVVGLDAPREFARARREIGHPLSLLADWSPAA